MTLWSMLLAVVGCGPATTLAKVIGQFEGGVIEQLAVAGNTLYAVQTVYYETPVQIADNAQRTIEQARLLILDANDPANVRPVASLTAPDYLGALAVSGSTLFAEVGIQFKGLETEAGTIDQQWIENGWLFVDDTSYSQGAFTGVSNLVAIDVSDPANPQIVGALNLTPDDKIPSKIKRIDIEGDIAFVKADGLETFIVDISDPRRLRLLGVMDHGMDVAHQSGKLYVADGAALTITSEAGVEELAGGFKIVEVSDPSAMTELGRLDSLALGDGEYGANVEEVAVRGDYAYVGLSILKGLSVTEFLVVVDVSNAGAPKEVVRYKLNDGVLRLMADDSTLYAVGDSGALHFYDLADPAKPKETRRVDFQPLEGILQTVVTGQRAYLGGYDGLFIIDLAP